MKYVLSLFAAMLLMCCSTENGEIKAQTMTPKMYITIGSETHSVTLVDNAATQELVSRLQSGDINVTLDTNGSFEIWGPLGFSLPTSNEQITAQPGDVILYGGSNICIFCGTNSWSYTRLGHIDGLSESELRTFLKIGQSDIAVKLSLSSETTAVNSVCRTASEDGACYSLNGQRVDSPSKGIYIRNGKKVVL